MEMKGNFQSSIHHSEKWTPEVMIFTKNLKSSLKESLENNTKLDIAMKVKPGKNL